MTDAYNVDTGQLSTAARTLAGLADDLRAALASVSGVTVTDGAYGQLCAKVVGAIRQLGDAGQGALQDGVDALDWACDTMNQTASTYEQQENEQAAVFTQTDQVLA